MRFSIQIEFDKIMDLETDKTSVTVGRSTSCDIVIPHDAISRQHCKIDFEDKNFYITDLGSSNGVFINDQRIPLHVKTPYEPGTPLALGKLDCELSQFKRVKDRTIEKIVNIESHPSGDYTATIRVARLDINREILSTRKLTLEAPKVKGPRNPVTMPIKEEPVKKRNLLPLILLIIVGAVIYYFSNQLGRK